jgi:subtilisin family serine protease
MMRLLVATFAAACALAGVASAAPVQPNDPAWPEQWAQRQIGLPQIWETTTGDPSVVIATIDTGVNPIPDLADALVPGWDFVENDAIAQDTHSHGTRVASVIAARGNNQIAMAGHCWRCKIMPVRVTAGGTVRPERIAQGIIWAVDHGARIINVSLTHAGAPDPYEREAVRYAIDRGVLVVAGAGNAGTDVPEYPAAYPGVLSVGATDDTDKLYFWSSRGPWVLLAAPGCHMIVDISTPPGTICGTSFTPAAVSGVAGLLISRNPSLTVNQVIGILTSTARPVPGILYGRVDPVAAFSRLGLLAPSTTTQPAPTTSPPTSTTSRTIVVRGQRFTREARVETGTFRRGFRTTFRVGKGRFEVQLQTPLARQCTLSLITANELTIAAPAVRNLLSISMQVTAGRYTAAVRCSGTRSRRFSMGVIAMFPQAAP